MESLTVPGSLSSLSPIGSYVMSAAKEAGLEKGAAYRLRLAIDEIATNIILYGYQEGKRPGSIDIHAKLDSEALTITLEDSAPAYDPRTQPRPDDLDEPLGDREIGGLGVFLAVEGVDRFAYEWVNTHNRNIFVMYRGSATGAT